MFETQIQETLLSRLRADSNITSVVAGIYDNVPQPDRNDDVKFPYIVLGDDILNEWDTDTENGVDASVSIHVWSRYRGRKEVKRIQGLIYNCLHETDFIDNGFIFVNIIQEQSQSFMDPDGLTRHGIQTFRILVQRED